MFATGIHPGQKNVSLKIDDECRWTKVTEMSSLISVNLVFSQFNSVTDYKGTDADGLHIFVIKPMLNPTKMDITFLFSETNKSLSLAKLGVKSDTYT